MTETGGETSPRDRLFLSFVSGETIVHQPALDGVRGFAVAAVVLLHLHPHVVPGGAGGVSLFFTLSGFLIATLILHSSRVDDRFAAKQFWLSRARRLLPASLVTVAAVSLLRAATDTFDTTTRPEAAMTLLQGMNWYLLLRENSPGYSALGHTWSLSIEEQFYIVVAVAMVVVVRRRLSLRTLAIVALAASIASFLVPVVFNLSGPRVYAGTDTRAGEILAGVVLATVVFTSRDRRWLLQRRGWVALVGLAGALGLTVLFLRTDHSAFGVDLQLFPLMSLCSITFILGALVPGGPVHAALRTRAITWLGRRSYGVYLYHIPIAVAVDGWQLAHTRLGRAALVLVMTLPLAALSYRVLEMPVRRQQFRGLALAIAATVAIAIIAACSFIE